MPCQRTHWLQWQVYKYVRSLSISSLHYVCRAYDVSNQGILSSCARRYTWSKWWKCVQVQAVPENVTVSWWKCMIFLLLKYIQMLCFVNIFIIFIGLAFTGNLVHENRTYRSEDILCFVIHVISYLSNLWEKNTNICKLFLQKTFSLFLNSLLIYPLI